MSQTINQAVQYGSLCFLLGGLAALHQPPMEGTVVRQETVGWQGCVTPTRGAAAQRCVLLQPKVRHPFHSVVHAVRRAIRGWRQ
jgi:hypothetical protein